MICSRMTVAMATSAGEGFNSSNQAFRKHCSDMLKAIQDPEALAWDLYAEKIISAAVRNAAINKLWSRKLRSTLECSLCFCPCSTSDPKWVTFVGE